MEPRRDTWTQKRRWLQIQKQTSRYSRWIFHSPFGCARGFPPPTQGPLPCQMPPGAETGFPAGRTLVRAAGAQWGPCAEAGPCGFRRRMRGQRDPGQELAKGGARTRCDWGHSRKGVGTRGQAAEADPGPRTSQNLHWAGARGWEASGGPQACWGGEAQKCIADQAGVVRYTQLHLRGWGS